MEECAELAKRLAKRAASELGIPMYLYEYAAASEERRNLAYLRKGEYEALATKLPTLKPDFGPCELNESVKKSGATVTGARKVINLIFSFDIFMMLMQFSTNNPQKTKKTVPYCLQC